MTDPKGICSCCEQEFSETSLGAFGEDCLLCENCFADGIPKLKKQLAEKDKRIKELEARAQICYTDTSTNMVKELQKEIADLKAELKNEQSKRGVGINQVLLDENKNLKERIAEALRFEQLWEDNKLTKCCAFHEIRKALRGE